MSRLTKPFILSQPIPKEGSTILWDDALPGFGVRIMPSGTRTFFFNYRNAQKKQCRFPIGHLGDPPVGITMQGARKKAEGLLGDIRKHIDPQAGRAVERGAITFAHLAEEYIRRRCSQKKSGPEDARILRKDFLPLWGRKLARDVRRNDVTSAIDEIKKRGPIIANRSLFVLGRLFNFGLDNELIESSPAARVKPLKEKSRDRVLTPEEIRLFWQKLDAVQCEPTTRLAMRLILVTAQRPGEVVGLDWSEIQEDEDGAWWTIPGDKAKNRLTHRVPLSPLALELLHSLPHGDAGPVFDSLKFPGRSIERHSMSMALTRSRETIGLERFTPHDLRRTAATQMAIMGVSPFTISKILNHQERGVTKIYTRASYDAEKRAALERWASELRDILAGRKKKPRKRVSKRQPAKVLPIAG